MRDKRQEAVRLRDEEKQTFNEIASRLGVSTTTIQRWTKPDFERRTREVSAAWKARNREANRARDRKYAHRPQNRGRCTACGGLRGIHSARQGDGLCIGCIVARKEDRWRVIQSMWADGCSHIEIAAALEVTVAYVGMNVKRMREAGWDLPRRYKLKVAA